MTDEFRGAGGCPAVCWHLHHILPTLCFVASVWITARLKAKLFVGTFQRLSPEMIFFFLHSKLMKHMKHES